MANLLMITGDRAFAQGKKGAFYNTLEEFHKHWDRIDIICPRVAVFASSPFPNIEIHASPWPIWLQPWFIFRKGQEIFKNKKFSLMTVHEYPPFYNGIGAWLMWRQLGVPYILEIMHIPGYPKAGTLKEWVYRNLMRIFIKMDSSKALKVRVINKKQTPEFLTQAGVPESKILYIPANYIDLDIFKPGEEQKKYDAVFVGRLEPNKGIKLFLEAVSASNSSALIVGDGSLRKDIEKEINKNNWSDRIKMHGWAKDSHEVARLLRESKILIMPSYNEGGPRVVLEAMACGVPVLATSVGIIPDVVENNRSGLIIDWDAKDIPQKADSILGDSELYNQLRNEGLKIVQQFEKKASLRNYADKLRALI